MRALFLQHNENELPGVVGDRLRHHGIDVVPLLVTDGVAFPDPADFDMIVPLGAPESVTDADIPWIPPELDMLRRAVDRDVPTFAICFGAQMLAHALGGTVRRAEQPEIGWARLEVRDPELLVADEWFELHFDVFTSPPGAHELARNATGSQAFSIGRHLGVQFHPEITPEILADWVHAWPAVFADAGANGESLVEKTRLRTQAARQATTRLVDVWLARLERADGDPSGTESAGL